MAAAKEEAVGGAVASAVVTTLSLTNTTQIVAGSMEWTDLTSVGISLVKNLTWLGAMGACMYLTSARVISMPATSTRFNKTGKMMGRSWILCHILDELLTTTTWGGNENPNGSREHRASQGKGGQTGISFV